MSVKQATTDTTIHNEVASTTAAGKAAITQENPWLRFAKRVWWLLVLATLTIFIISLPARYSQLQSLEVVNRSPADILRAIDANLVRASLEELGLSRSFYATYNIILEALYALIFFVIALIIFRRKSNDGVGLFVSLTLIMFGTASIPTMAALAWVDKGWDIPLRYLNVAGWILLLVFFYVFPDGKFTPRWTRPLVIVFVIWSLAHTTWRDAFFSPWIWPAWVPLTIWALWFAGGVIAEIYSYRKVYTPAERKQTKWVLYGMVIAVSGILLVSLPNILYRSGALAEHPGPLYELVRLPVQFVLALILPIAIGIAIVRANLYNIDIIINRTLVYVPLTAILAGLYSASISLFQRVFMAVTGEKSDAAVVITTLILAATFTPMKNGLQSLVDKLFKEAPDTTKGIRALATRIDGDLAVLDDHKVTRRLLQETVNGFRATGGALYLDHGHGEERECLLGDWSDDRDPVEMEVPIERKDGTRLGRILLGPRKDDDDDKDDDRDDTAKYTEKERQALQEVATVVAEVLPYDVHPVEFTAEAQRAQRAC